MLTPRQSALLSYIETYQRERGYSPSLREMAAGIGAKSGSTAFVILENLAERGFVRRAMNTERSVEVIRKPGQGSREAALERTLKAIRDLPVRQIVENPDVVRRMAATAVEG